MEQRHPEKQWYDEKNGETERVRPKKKGKVALVAANGFLVSVHKDFIINALFNKTLSLCVNQSKESNLNSWPVNRCAAEGHSIIALHKYSSSKK